jgi:hypothetical protein
MADTHQAPTDLARLYHHSLKKRTQKMQAAANGFFWKDEPARKPGTKSRAT